MGSWKIWRVGLPPSRRPRSRKNLERGDVSCYVFFTHQIRLYDFIVSRVAEDLKRPLYVVGASELGFSPQDVERKLRQILDVSSIFFALSNASS